MCRSRTRCVTQPRSAAEASSGTSAPIIAAAGATRRISSARSRSIPAHDVRERIDADDRIGVHLRAGRVHGAERDVVGLLGDRALHLRGVVGRDADAHAGGDAADDGHRQVRLADVHPFAAGEDGEVDPVVREQRHPSVAARWVNRTQKRQRLARRRVLRAQLERRGTRFGDRAGELDDGQTAADEGRNIDDRVEPSHRDPASSSPARSLSTPSSSDSRADGALAPSSAAHTVVTGATR
jgi:hypothetical protein